MCNIKRITLSQKATQNGGGWTRTSERIMRAVLQTAVIATRLHRQKL